MPHEKPKKVLLVAGNWWPSAARLAVALVEHGCAVSAVCPPGHPLRYVRGVHEIHPYRCLASRRSLAAAIQRVDPDFVLPCDDRSASQLHELHRLHRELRPLIERSLGRPDGFDVLESRARLLDTARELGIRTAATCTVATPAEVTDCYNRCSPIAVMKIDGSSGGEGVHIVRSPQEAASAFRQLTAATGLATALKRMVVNRDPQALWSWSRRDKAATTMQMFVRGTPANIMVACWHGRIVGEVSVRTISSQGETGAALVIQLIDHDELSRAAAALAKHLGLSGFFGLDFILEHRTGAAYLIEMNPRCTQLGHLRVPNGDLAGAWCTVIMGAGKPNPPMCPIATDKIAFFPQAWQWQANEIGDPGVYHDVPWHEKRLVEALMRAPWPERWLLARIYHLFRRQTALQAFETAPVWATETGSAEAAHLATINSGSASEVRNAGAYP